jgi:FkbM family methyltransferase
VSLGCVKVLPVSKLRWKYPDTFLPFFWEDLPHKVYEQAAAVKAASTLWSDEFSRREYAAQIRWRTRGDFDGLAAPVPEESYFPGDLFSLSREERFVDCGAYDGCTVKSFLKRSEQTFGRIIALEPDSTSCQRLRDYLLSLPADVRDRIEVLEMAVGSRRETVRFNAIGTVLSAITSEGGVEVSCAPLDELVGGIRPTYIKMDIEGAEPDALMGAKQILREYQPILAICVYHHHDHLWRIPLLIHEMNEGYRFYLRPHDCDGFQLVCYAVPPNRSLLPK